MLRTVTATLLQLDEVQKGTKAMAKAELLKKKAYLHAPKVDVLPILGLYE